MSTYRAPLLAGVFVLGLLVFSGCDCGTRGTCTPPPPPPPPRAPICNPCATPIFGSTAPASEIDFVYAGNPSRGVCWVSGPYDPIVLPEPPTVTRNQAGQVVSTTPAGHLAPPSSELAFASF